MYGFCFYIELVGLFPPEKFTNFSGD